MNTATWNPLNGGTITPNVCNEFGTLKIAILSLNATPELFATAYGESVETVKGDFSSLPDNDVLKVLFDHEDFLKKRGVRIVHPHHPNLRPTPETISAYVGDDMYCRDFLTSIDQTAILSTLSSYRNAVRGHYQGIMKAIPSEKQVQCHQPFSFGNALLASDTLLVGVEHYDNLNAMQQHLESYEFTQMLQRIEERNEGIKEMRKILEQIKSSRKLIICFLNLNTDVDTVVAPLPRKKRTDQKTAIVSREQIHPSSFSTLKRLYDNLIPCPDPWEKLGCNILWLDSETPLVSAEAIRTISLLRSLNYNVQTRPVSPLVRDSSGESDGSQPGGWRCATGVLERANDYDFD